jgi:5'-nucleotidase
MRILITNDDGVYSPGIAALAQVASRFGETRIVAPDVEMSSASSSITSSRPLSYKRTQLPVPVEGVEAYRVNGTPSDCVTLGVSVWEDVGLVLSGINLGTNLGNAIWHSGTLAGAKQASLLGLRGIAFSVPATEIEQPNFELLKTSVAAALERLLEAPELKLVNVNLPASAPRGMVWTRQSVRHYDGKVVPGKDPMGRSHYWYTVVPLEATDEGTDRWAIEQGYVSMTPLRVDLTDEAALERMRRQQAPKQVRRA